MMAPDSGQNGKEGLAMVKKIELALSKKDFETLLMHLYVGNWVLTDTMEDDAEVEKLDKYFGKFLSAAKKQGFADLVTYDKKLKESFLKEDLEEECLDAIDDYEDLNFWEALASRLAERDLDREYEGSGIDEMTMTAKQVDEKYKKYLKQADRYGKEFTAAGIDRLKIDEALAVKKAKNKLVRHAAETKAKEAAPEKKPAGKKSVAKKLTEKKPAEKKPAAKKLTAKKPATAKKAAVAKKPAEKIKVAKKAPVKALAKSSVKAPAKSVAKAPAKKAETVKVATAKKATVKTPAPVKDEPKIAPKRGPKTGPKIAPKSEAKVGVKKATDVVAKPVKKTEVKTPAKRGRKPKAEKAAGK